jgi:hypothetical protein
MKLTQGSELMLNDSGNIGSVHSSGGAAFHVIVSVFIRI